MTRKTMVVILAAVLSLVLLGGVFVRMRNSAKKKNDESSETAEMTQVIIIPSEMPVNISIPIPNGFTETSSEYYDKYYIRDDASIIVTGEELRMTGQTLSEYTDGILKQYEKSVDEFLLINNAAVESGEPCRVLEFTYALIGEDARQDFQCITAVFLKDNRAYLVTCKSRKENFMSYRGAFLMMIEKITIQDAVPSPAQTTGSALPERTEFGAESSGTTP